MTRWRKRVRWGAALLLACGLAVSDPGPAAAQQYGSSFYYRNPRTGQTYGFSNSYGRYGTGTTLYYGRPGFQYQSTNGYGNGHVWGGYNYQTPRYGSAMRWCQ